MHVPFTAVAKAEDGRLPYSAGLPLRRATAAGQRSDLLPALLGGVAGCGHPGEGLPGEAGGDDRAQEGRSVEVSRKYWRNSNLHVSLIHVYTRAVPHPYLNSTSKYIW